MWRRGKRCRLAGRLGRAVAAGLVVFAVGGAAARAEMSARQVIDHFHATLIGVMTRAGELGYKGRYDALSPEIARVFHIPVMARIVAGAHWRGLNDTQKAALIDAFGRMTAATYASRFDGYSGEKFRVVGEAESRRKSIVVKSEIVKSDGEAIPINYLMRQFRAGWRVVDVQLKGAYSELATRRSEYSSILDRSGIDELLAVINRKVAGYASESR